MPDFHRLFRLHLPLVKQKLPVLPAHRRTSAIPQSFAPRTRQTAAVLRHPSRRISTVAATFPALLWRPALSWQDCPRKLMKVTKVDKECSSRWVGSRGKGQRSRSAPTAASPWRSARPGLGFDAAGGGSAASCESWCLDPHQPRASRDICSGRRALHPQRCPPGSGASAPAWASLWVK